MIYKLPTLRYDYKALEPYIDGQTMELHYKAHHGGYVTNLNKTLEQCPNTVRSKSLEDIIRDIRVVPEDLRQDMRNFGGGHLNHSLFWQTISPDSGSLPESSLIDSIIRVYKDFERFKILFKTSALGRFGSGWCWLCIDEQRRLEIVTTPNQDSPIMLGYRPIFGIDLWEHAFYLKYKNRRADYIDAWWHVLDWKKATELYEFYQDVHHLKRQPNNS